MQISDELREKLNEIVKQLELCQFKDNIGHKLEQNCSFIELKKLAKGSDFSFSKALEYLKTGRKVTRKCWENRMFLYYVRGDVYNVSTGVLREYVQYRPYIALKTEQEDVVPWTASPQDLLAEDWVLME